jgi:hypothetical protein
MPEGDAAPRCARADWSRIPLRIIKAAHLDEFVRESERSWRADPWGFPTNRLWLPCLDRPKKLGSAAVHPIPWSATGLSEDALTHSSYIFR